jgi:hypothetical protein
MFSSIYFMTGYGNYGGGFGGGYMAPYSGK